VFDHVTVRASDRQASQRFYDTVLQTLGIEATYSDSRFAEWDDFSLTAADDENPVTRRLHIGFGAPSREHVDRFWRAGTEAGFRDDGPPGPRPAAPTAKRLVRDDYYGAFLLDPDGNSAEAVHHGDVRAGGRDGVIDHLWIRVADVPKARSFYVAIAEYSGYDLRDDEPDFARFVDPGGSFSLVDGTPTEHVHLAFPASENATVDAFHRAAIEAGYRDHGAPGERPHYHPGYYGAYVLDPDGNNIEVVNHNR
jgi:catechol 2,3-dioxygenase-like lactoylglutathione lyase family enzyme